MNILILGQGNLGQDLAIKLAEKNHKVVTLKRQDYDGRFHDKNIDFWCNLLSSHQIDIVFNAIGCGSVKEGKDDWFKQFDLCVGTNKFLLNLPFPLILIGFGSDYAIGEPKSLYATNKRFMEHLFHHYEPEKVAKVIRVSTLYGSHIPERSLLFRMLKNNWFASPVELSDNYVYPTPTDWLAGEIAHNLNAIINFEGVVLDIAPRGLLSIRQIGEILFPKGTIFTSSGMDKERPELSGLGKYLTYLDNSSSEELLIKRKKDFIEAAELSFIPYA